MNYENESMSMEDGYGDYLADMHADMLADEWWERYRDEDGGSDSPSFSCSSPVVAELVGHIVGEGVAHDFADVLCEQKVEDVLKLYHLEAKLSWQEQKELSAALFVLGGRVQSREMWRFVSENGGHPSSHFGTRSKREEDQFVRAEELFRKVFREALREKHVRDGRADERFISGFICERSCVA